ncbi:PH domain-containing protein [Jeotgalicoccus halotolerans]|uniref:PH (Pleckstrin Homology) domain-containing protein n=1 Tax=Jeotgalicoccus halotolerans TaxID=157227 RepID=A0A3E0B036_9STAP|nr:PH domain-containing protein [Jeotgalicoccus halotolerans]REG25326.1 PH (Pleckstrin Homology) domain-containing protein [Jeotgalicoccus halotolerans]
MTFKSKIDLSFSIMMIICIAVIALAGAFAFFLGASASFSTIILLLIVIIPIILLLILMTFNTRYTFHDDYLHAKSVIFGSKIPYRDIFKVHPTSNFISGYRMMTSKDGIEIHSRSIAFGSLRISPENKSLFIEELKKRAHHADYQDI